jgi:hypothetical protein
MTKIQHPIKFIAQILADSLLRVISLENKKKPQANGASSLDLSPK